MEINPLETIYGYDQKIRELKDEIKTIEEKRQRCIDYAMVRHIEFGGGFILRTSVLPRREPISSKVIESIGSEKALTIAKFNIKDLERLISKDAIDALCKVKESITRVVEKVEG